METKQLVQLLDRALTHLSTAREDTEDAAASLPAGNKAGHALTQLREVAHYLREMAIGLADPVSPPAAQAQLELNGLQVLQLAQFVIPGWVSEDAPSNGALEELNTPVTVAVDPPTAPPGTWAWCSEYPEEGAQQLLPER